MEPEIKERPAFAILGYQVRANPGQANYEEIWTKGFGPREAEVAPFSPDQAYYAGYFCTGEEGRVDILSGMRVEGLDTAPEGLVLRQVPAGPEAVFTCTMAEIGRTWGHIYGEWLETSGYQRDPNAPDYEVYPAGFNPASDSLTLHVPVLRQAP